MFCCVGDSVSCRFFSSSLLPLLVLLRIRPGFRGLRALKLHFGLRWRRPMQAGVFFWYGGLALQFCSFFPYFFLAKVTAVSWLFFGPGFIFGTLLRCSFFMIRNFFIFALFASNFCFGVLFFLGCRTGGSITWKFHLACTSKALVQGQEVHRLGAGVSFRPSRC